VLLALGLAGCSSQEQKTEAASRPAPPAEVRVATVETRPVDRSILVTGSLLPDETVNLAFEAAGTLARVHTDFGQPVRRGQVLAELDRRELNLQLERSRAALAQALARIGLNPDQVDVNPETTPAIRQAAAQYEDARFKHESARKLVETGDIARERAIELEKQFRAREAALQAARDELRTQLASIQGIRAEVNLAQKRLADATLEAPFDGAVSARLASPGQYLRENTPVLTVVKTHPLRLRLEIPESAVSEVRAGTSLTFTTDAAPGVEFQAVVRQLNPALDAQSRSLVAEARPTRADARLKPGMFVQVRLVTVKGQQVTMAPQRAVYTVAGLSKLFVVRDGRVTEYKARPGAVSGEWVEAPPEVRPGDRVAVSNLQNLVDGAAVTAR
jgi:RND family efflux transporter MFP subunit